MNEPTWEVYGSKEEAPSPALHRANAETYLAKFGDKDYAELYVEDERLAWAILVKHDLFFTEVARYTDSSGWVDLD